MDNNEQSPKRIQSRLKLGMKSLLALIKEELLAPRNRLFVLTIAIFIVARGINLSDSYLWYDDVATIGSFIKRDWGDIFSSSVGHVQVISGPLIPTILDRVLLNIFGPNLIVLRLPNLFASLSSLLLIYAISTRLFPNSSLRYLPGLLFSISIPSIIYSQGIQPSIFFFLSSCLQLWYFIKMITETTERSSRETVFRHIQLFTRTSVLTFFINYMSVLVYGLLILSYLVWLILRKDPGGFSRSVKKLPILITELTLEAIPLAYLTYLRWQLFVNSHGGDSSLNYLDDAYFPKTIVQFAQAFYDTITYHFNFSYSSNIYTPHGVNAAALPFVLVCTLGAVYFFFNHRKRPAFFILTCAYLMVIVHFNIIPLGGVRHSFTFAPFAYLAICYGIRAIQEYGKRIHLPSKIETWAGFSLVTIMALTFGTSGVNIYEERKSRVRLDELKEISQRYDVDLIIGYQETKSILAAMIHTQSGRENDYGFRLKTFNEETHQELTETYLLVTNRYMFNPNPDWPIADIVKIPGSAFQNHTVTPLIEEIGPLDPFTPVQSIYYPINGFFVYLVEPSQSD